jgi:hypothetical protein
MATSRSRKAANLDRGRRRPAFSGVDDREPVKRLLGNIKKARPRLRALLDSCSDHWGYEDGVYRLYHGSFKVYELQHRTEVVVTALQALLPDATLNEWFMRIVREGTGHEFSDEHNKDWLKHTRPIVEAFFHARYFLEMVVRYAGLRRPPTLVPSGWASVLYLFNLR